MAGFCGAMAGNHLPLSLPLSAADVKSVLVSGVFADDGHVRHSWGLGRGRVGLLRPSLCCRRFVHIRFAKAQGCGEQLLEKKEMNAEGGRGIAIDKEISNGAVLTQLHNVSCPSVAQADSYRSDSLDWREAERDSYLCTFGAKKHIDRTSVQNSASLGAVRGEHPREVSMSSQQWRRVAASLLPVLLMVAMIGQPPPSSLQTFENVPQLLSEDDKKPMRIQRPKSAKAETCTRKCVATCIRGGAGAPGEGPLNVRRPLVVFKEGFRTRKYCLVECSDICNLIDGRDDGP